MMPMEKVEILRACCCITGAGGTTSEQERTVLEKLAGQIGVGQASLQAMISRGETDPDFFREQFQVLKSDPQQTMKILIQSAMSDGELTSAENTMLVELSRNLGMPQQDLQHLMDNIAPSEPAD